MPRTKKTPVPAPELRLLDAVERVGDLAASVISARPPGRRKKPDEAFRAMIVATLGAMMPALEMIAATVRELVAEASGT